MMDVSYAESFQVAYFKALGVGCSLPEGKNTCLCSPKSGGSEGLIHCSTYFNLLTTQSVRFCLTILQHTEGGRQGCINGEEQKNVAKEINSLKHLKHLKLCFEFKLIAYQLLFAY